MSSMLVPPRGYANLLEKMAEAKRVARRASVARAAIYARELAHRRCKRWRFYTRCEFQWCLRGAPRETVALQQAQKFRVQARGQQRIRLRRFRRVQVPVQAQPAHQFTNQLVA